MHQRQFTSRGPPRAVGVDLAGFSCA
jgi:hypothetical protein